MMRRFRHFIIVAALATGCATTEAARCPTPADPTPQTQTQPVQDDGFDADLAARLRADDYGMARYVIAFLRAGPNREQTKEEAEALQRAHMQNIARMASEGQLVVAGPFLDDGEVRGIYVFDVATIEEAEALTNTDPAVQAGRLIMELHPWYGSAALREVGSIHERIARTSP